jgi:hypothetical protein
MSASSSEDRLAARAACEELFLDFHRHVDDGHATRALALFADDPEPRLEVRGEAYVGKAALERFLRAREQNTTRQTRHLASNFRFVLHSGARARATANLSLFNRGGPDGAALTLEAVVDCELEFVQVGAEWRVSSRRHSRFASVRV